MKRFSQAITFAVTIAFCFGFGVFENSASAQDYRTWTSANGKHSFEAELVSSKNGKVSIKGRDGKIKSMKLSQLSEADQDYVTKLVKARANSSGNLSKIQKERLKDLGLRLAKDEFAFLDERKLKSAISNSLKIKKNLIEMELQLQQMNLGSLQAQNQIVALKQKNVQLNSALANASGVRENNQIVGLLNANRSQIELLQKSIDDLDDQIKDGQSFINKKRDEFVLEIMAVRKLSDSFDEKAKSLKVNDEFVAIRGDIEESLQIKVKPLGESKSLARIRTNLEKLENIVLSDTIQLLDRGSGTFEATVSINGKETIELVVDSGASLVTLPERLAQQMGIRIGPEARPIRMTIADGSVINGKLIVLDSVRLGKFEAKNVECAILGREAVNAPNLLGMSFLGNFKFELDAAKGEITIMTVETED